MTIAEDIQEKARNVILGILEQSGGTVYGKVRLFKAFYLAHLFHFQKQDGVLSDYPIVRMPRGPAIDNANSLFAELVNKGLIEVRERYNGPYIEQVYTVCASAKPADLTKEEQSSIKDAVQWVANRSAQELSELMHEFSNTWWDTSNGSEMNIYADLLDEEAYNEMNARQGQIKEKINAARKRRDN